MIFDLHTHSTASDGHLSPEQLLDRAVNNGVSHLALTDHDTMAGFEQLQNVADLKSRWPIHLVPGVEISASIDQQPYHIVGLWLNPATPVLKDFLSQQQILREQRGEMMGIKLERLGMTGALAGAKKIAAGASLSRPHFAQYLLQQGYCDKLQQAYKRWLGKGKPADVKINWPSASEVVSVIHAAGGLAVFAHPDKYGLTKTRLRDTLAVFKASGGDGLELISGHQDGCVTDYLLRLSHKFELACSMGSDFHTLEQYWSDVGCHKALPATALPVWELPQIKGRLALEGLGEE